MENLQQTVSEHAIQISVISSNLTDMKEYLKEISRAIKSQELLMEKLSNIETSHEDSKKRMYRTIENIEDRVSTIEKVVDTTCPIVDTDMKNLSSRITSLESNQKWVVRLIIGTVILGLLGLVIVSP